MHPARKLLSLLFLILMGTELTQVRASNAIFLPARRPARPPRGAPQSPGTAPAPRRPAPPAWAPEAPGLGRGQGAGPDLGGREGCRLTRDGAPPVPAQQG